MYNVHNRGRARWPHNSEKTLKGCNFKRVENDESKLVKSVKIVCKHVPVVAI